MMEQPTFRIGICMAGAVSAGAFTAGVIDYLIETLDHWQRAKNLGLKGIPLHQVSIEVISGASAGGMTAAVTAAALQQDFPPVCPHTYNNEQAQLNPLYHSWVNLTEAPARDMMAQLLDTHDIDHNKGVHALLNSGFIDAIARRVIDTTVKKPGLHRPYIADNMELLMTFCNLRGFEQSLKFISCTGKSEYTMCMHKDLAHFVMSPAGAYNRDGKIPLHFNDEDGCSKELLMQAAMATGAFPLGLAPRILIRKPEYINDNPFLQTGGLNGLLVNPLLSYINVASDGGLMNNEPFELTEQALLNKRKEALKQWKGASAASYEMPRRPETIDTFLLMIDPFPADEVKPDTGYASGLAWTSSLPALLSAMRSQLLVKAEELKKVYDENDYSRFMISPVRTLNGRRQQHSIACGSLAGFGGFLGRGFRHHDYMLGRRNCQRFIRRHLCIPLAAGNPVLKAGYAGLENDYAIHDPAGVQYLPLIPDVRVNAEGILYIPPIEEEPAYPNINLAYLAQQHKPLANRIDAILKELLKPGPASHAPAPGRKSMLKRLLSQYISSPAIQLYTYTGRALGKGRLAAALLEVVEKDLRKRGLVREE